MISCFEPSFYWIMFSNQKAQKQKFCRSELRNSDSRTSNFFVNPCLNITLREKWPWLTLVKISHNLKTVLAFYSFQSDRFLSTRLWRDARVGQHTRLDQLSSIWLGVNQDFNPWASIEINSVGTKWSRLDPSSLKIVLYKHFLRVKSSKF